MIYLYLCALIGIIGGARAFTAGDFIEMGFAMSMAVLAIGHIANDPSAPRGCGGSCNQGRKACNCVRAKG